MFSLNRALRAQRAVATEALGYADVRCTPPRPKAQKPSRVNRLLSEQPMSASLPIQLYALCSPMLPLLALNVTANSRYHTVRRLSSLFDARERPQTHTHAQRTVTPEGPARVESLKWAREVRLCGGVEEGAERSLCIDLKIFAEKFFRIGFQG